MDNSSRRRCRSLARSVVALEEKVSKEEDREVRYPVGSLIDVWNTKYGYVKDGDTESLENLKRQIEADVEAERLANSLSFKKGSISRGAVSRTAFDRVTGALTDGSECFEHP